MNLEAGALETLRLVEALLAGATTEGERAAAARARERLLEKLHRLRATAVEVEFQFSMPDPWARRLLIAILRKHEIRPFRYPRQRRTTVMARAPEEVINGMVWPEFLQIRDGLAEHLLDITNRIIRDALDSDGSDAEVIQGQLPLGGRLSQPPS